jgi:hypothetical protein
MVCNCQRFCHSLGKSSERLSLATYIYLKRERKTKFLNAVTDNMEEIILLQSGQADYQPASTSQSVRTAEVLLLQCLSDFIFQDGVLYLLRVDVRYSFCLL